MIGNDVVECHRRQDVVEDAADGTRSGKLLVPLQARDLVRDVGHQVQSPIPVPVSDSRPVRRVPVFVRVGEVFFECDVFSCHRVRQVLPVVGSVAGPGRRIAELHEAGNRERFGIDQPR